MSDAKQSSPRTIRACECPYCGETEGGITQATTCNRDILAIRPSVNSASILLECLTCKGRWWIEADITVYAVTLDCDDETVNESNPYDVGDPVPVACMVKP